MSFTRRGKPAGPAPVIRLDEHRAKYLVRAPPTDAFLLDAQTLIRVLTAGLRWGELGTGDLRNLLGRIRTSLEMYSGDDPLAETLRQQALVLAEAIWAMG